VQILPNAVAIPLAADTPPPGQTILMVGAYTYGPNADAAEFFINDILPLLRKRFPEAQLWLAGAGTEGLASFGRAPANVRFLGFVDDLAALYAAARIVVCPVRYGGGTRVKLVEAAAWGKAIVTTTLGAEGLGMSPGRDALFADLPGEFAEACARLIEDEALCASLGGNARRLAIEQFDQVRIVARLASTFEHEAATA
jgi:glycosyltransferase involved in cell wall biosynthesis